MQSYYKSLAKFLDNLSSDVSKLMLERFDSEHELKKLPNGSAISEVDTEVNLLINQRIAENYPYYMFISEQSKHKEIVRHESYFIIDEICGSELYINKKSGFSFRGAFFDPKDGLITSVVSYPKKDYYLSMTLEEPIKLTKGGNTKELPKIQMKKTEDLVYGYPDAGDEMQYLKLLKSIGIADEHIKKETDSRLYSILTGKYDIAIIMEPSIPEWEWTAEKAILNELGYAFTYLTGENFTFGQKPSEENPGYLVCPAYCKDEIVSKMRFFVNNL
ncbi:MAG: hypothetical protein CMO01_10690 [Thalassobius sp.]|nr:hypothetical protein [Thalassovita sp.]|tara:strand:+ start:419 stop:1240 length:822 start_codon:yes stop_codon:yes gene_type:complete